MKGFENMTEAEALQKFGRKPATLSMGDLPRPPIGPKPSKYRNKKTVVDGITFDSLKEAKRYGELKLLQAAGEIHDLILQKPYAIAVPPYTVNLLVNGERVHVANWLADFDYWTKDDVHVVEDVKSAGTRTAVYRLKRKLIEALYDFRITEV